MIIRDYLELKYLQRRGFFLGASLKDYKLARKMAKELEDDNET